MVLPRAAQDPGTLLLLSIPQAFEVIMFAGSGSRRSTLILSLFASASCLLAPSIQAFAQTPVILPNLVSTVGGNTPTATVAGAACPTNPQFTAFDTIGDGCPATNATFSGNELNLTVDPAGNIYTTANASGAQIIRRIDARTGIISVFAGETPTGAAGGNACQAGNNITVNGTTYVQTDKVGDGCPVAYSGGFYNPNGLASDAYGNIFFADTSDQVIHVICNATSPICSAAEANVKLMKNIAGCTPSSTNYGTAVVGTTVGTAGDGGSPVQLTGTCTAGVNSPQAVVADKWDNVYFTDNSNNRMRVILGAASVTINGTTFVNPLVATLKTDPAYPTPIQGNVYPIAGGGTVCAAMTDTGGDACPFYQTTVASGSKVQGIGVLPDGDFVFDDGNGRLRVIYEGGTAVKAAILANGGPAAPVVGTSYGLVTGSTFLYYNSTVSGTYKGSLEKFQTGSNQHLAVDPAGNIYVGDQAQVLFYDISTGYLRRLGGGTVATSCNATANGDGCPLLQSKFGAGNGNLPIALDTLGNLYIQDIANKFIRRASAATLPTAGVNTTLTDPLIVHAPATGSSVAVTAAPSTDFSVGAAACAAANTDGSVDCTSTVTYAPKLLETRADPLTISTTVGTTTTPQTSLLDSTSTGSALVFDTSATPTTAVIGAATTGNTQVVLDGVGYAYVIGTQGISRVNIATSAATVITATAPTYFAVDPQGNVYTTAAGSTNVTRYSVSAAGTYTSSSVAIPTFSLSGTSTQGNGGPLAADVNGVLYIADTTNKQLIKFAQSSGSAQQLTQTALASPTAITQDYYGNLLVVDGTSVLKIPAAGFLSTTTSPAANPAVTFTTALTAPTAIAADQGGNVYVADNGTVTVRTLSGAQYKIPASATTSLPARGIAVDGAGNVFAVISTVAGITEDLRSTPATHDFGTDVSTPFAGTFGNAGSNAATGFNQTDAAGNYTFSAPAAPLAASAPTCNLASTALASGSACNTSIKFSPTATGSGAVPDVITLVPAPTLGALTLTGTKNGSTATTSTAISGNISGLVYSTGNETTFTITVTQSTGAPTGTVAVSIDSGTAVNYALTQTSSTTATATVPVSGLMAAAHTIVATYAGSSGITGSTSTTTNFTIAQASTTVTFVPSTTTEQVSQALGVGVLDATASSSGNTVPGTFIYTATPTAGGAAKVVDSASYLTIGSYTLAVTFTPTDSTDYLSSSSTFATAFTVTKASTTGNVGGSTFVVAPVSAGTAYTSVEAAAAALPATGGNIYIAPGTYTEQVLINQPNVQVHGLGGVATAVLLTAENGAFTTTPQPAYGILQNPFGFNNDEGSATLTIGRGAPLGSSSNTTPANFYMDYVAVANTYDTDSTNANAAYGTASNTCTATTTSSNFSLFTAGTLCGSQALAIYTTADKTVMNNVTMKSLQDTLAAFNVKNSYPSCPGGGPTCPARQYYWQNYIAGDVDYVFGDAAMVFDQTTFYTLYHGSSPAGAANVFAQSKGAITGSAGDYLSGIAVDNSRFTSEMDAGPLTNFYFGRPLSPYSTTALLNDTVDVVNPLGYESGNGITLSGSESYFEYGTTCTTANCSSTGRETATAQPVVQPLVFMEQFAPTNFLSQKFNANGVQIAPDSWIPTDALTAGINGFVPSTSSATITVGKTFTVLARPQVPGGGFIPTGTYTLTMNGTSLVGTPATFTGTLDPSGAAYGILPASMLPVGTYTFAFGYNGDSNFNSSNAPAFALNVVGVPTTTTIAVTTANPTFGQPVSVTATVAASSGPTPTGPVNLSVDGGAPVTANLVNGVATFTLNNLSGGSHTLQAVYTATGTDATSTSSTTNTTVAPAAQTITFKMAPTATSGASVTLSGTSSSGLPLTYTVTSGPATVSGTTLTYTGTGTVQVMASQAGNANYTAATPVTDTVTVGGLSAFILAVNMDGTVSRLTGTNLTPVSIYSGGGSPTQGAAVDASGNLWSVNPGTKVLSAFAPSGTPLSSSGFTGGGLSNPAGVAVDGLGQIWVTNSTISNASLSVFTNAGVPISPSTGYRGGGLSQPTAVAIDLSGNVWISNFNNDTVTEFIGGAAPSAPLSTALTNNTTGVRP